MKKTLFFSLFAALYANAMTLDETIDKALLHNNTLKKVSLEVAQSKENRASKQAQNYGRVDFMASYDHYNNARTLAPLTPMQIVGGTGAYEMATTKDMISTGIAYNVVLFNGFAQQNSYKISDIMYKNSIIKSKLSKEELIYNVRSLYLSILSLEEQLEAQKANTISQKSLYEKIEASYKLGSKSKLDTLKSKNSYEVSLSNEQKIAANINTLKTTLTMLMGGEDFDSAEHIDIALEESEEKHHDIESLKRYEMYELQTRIAEKKYKSADAAYYPIIDFSAYYGYNFGPNDTTNTFPTTGETFIEKGDFNSENIWQAGIHLKWNILDFGSKSATSQKEKLSMMSSQLDQADMKLELKKNLAIAEDKLALAKADYNSALSQHELLEEIVKVESLKYESNAVTLSDLLDSKAKEKIAYAKMISSKYAYQQAKYYIDYLLERGEKN